MLLMHCMTSHKQKRTTNNSLYNKTEPDTPLEEAYHVRSTNKQHRISVLFYLCKLVMYHNTYKKEVLLYMTRETLDKGIELAAQINSVVDLQTLITNAAMDDAELQASRDGRVLNCSDLQPEIAAKLLQVLKDEENKLEDQLAAL